MSEASELLKELKQQERRWKFQRWAWLALSLWIVFDHTRFTNLYSMAALLGGFIIAKVMNQWQGDPKARLLIKLYEEKLESEFIEEEIIRAKKLEEFITSSPQQPR
jgi:hypothetical protein